MLTRFLRQVWPKHNVEKHWLKQRRHTPEQSRREREPMRCGQRQPLPHFRGKQSLCPAIQTAAIKPKQPAGPTLQMKLSASPANYVCRKLVVCATTTLIQSQLPLKQRVKQLVRRKMDVIDFRCMLLTDAELRRILKDAVKMCMGLISLNFAQPILVGVL